MKKKVMSLLLICSMLMTMIPAMTVPAQAVDGYQMTEAEAWDAGLDVYIAWYNHIRPEKSTVRSYYDMSIFSLVYDQVFPDSDTRAEKLRDAYQYFEDHFDFKNDSDQLPYDIYLTLLYQCFYYFDQADEDQGLRDHMNVTAETFLDINDILSNELLTDAVDQYLNSPPKQLIEEFPSDFIREYAMGIASLPNANEWLDEAFGGVGNLFTLATAAMEASKFVNLGSLNQEFLSVLEYLAEDGTEPALRQAASTVHVAALDGSNDFIEDQIVRYAAGDTMTDTMLSTGLTVCVQEFAALASSAAAASGAAATAGGFGAALIAGTAMGLILADVAEQFDKGLSELLVGTNSVHSSNLDLYYLNAIRTNLSILYWNTLSDFQEDPSVRNARTLNAVSKLLYNTLLCENDYAGLCEDAFCTAGILKAGWAADLMTDGSYTSFMDEVARRNRLLKTAREQYTDLALQAFDTFTENRVHTVTFDPNGGSFAQLDALGLQATRGKIDTLDLTLPVNEPVRYGYRFLGWAESASAASAKYAAGGTYSQPDGEGDDATLYAVWEPVTFRVCFDANGGVFDGDGTTRLSRSKQYAVPMKLDVAQPYGKEGYVFAGEWALSPDGAGLYTHGTAVSDIGDPTTDDKVLYAVWRDAAADILYDYADDPTGKKVTAVTDTVDTSAGAVAYTVLEADKVTSYNGNSFKGWICPDPNGPYWWATAYGDHGAYTLYQPGDRLTVESDLALYAKWTYLVHYDYGNDRYVHAEVGDGTQYTAAQPALSNGGLVFRHWETVTADGETRTYAPGDLLELTEDLYLTAVWDEPAYETGGKVLDSAGQPVEGVIVEFFDSDGNAAGAALTDSTGAYSFIAHKTDRYTARFTKTGYNLFTAEPVMITAGSGALAPVTLSAGTSLEISACGMCGDRAVWMVHTVRKPIAGPGYTYYVEGTALSVVGAGEIRDCDFEGGPWNSFDPFVSVIIGDGITRIGSRAFCQTEMDWTNADLCLPDTLESIGEWAFYGARFSVAADLPDGLVSIGSNAFASSWITSLSIPASVRELGMWDGTGDLSYNPLGTQCRYLESITVDADNPVLCSRDGVLYTKDMTVLIAYPEGCAEESLVIPDTVERVAGSAFGATNYVGNLKDVTIPASVTDLSAFQMGVPFRSFTVAADHPLYCSVDGVIYSKDQKTLVLYPPASQEVYYRVLNGTETLASGAFTGCGALGTLALPDGLKRIESYAVQNCYQISASYPPTYSGLNGLIIPASVEFLGQRAIFQCNALTDVYFMGPVPATFGNEAFYYTVSAYVSGDLTLHYVDGMKGWTPTTWTAPDGKIYKTERFVPGAVFELAVDEADSSVTCTVNAAMSDFTRMIVGVYESGTGKLIGTAMGTYNGTDNTLKVTFDLKLPASYDLKVFCMGDEFEPRYEIREHSQTA